MVRQKKFVINAGVAYDAKGKELQKLLILSDEEYLKGKLPDNPVFQCFYNHKAKKYYGAIGTASQVEITYDDDGTVAKIDPNTLEYLGKWANDSLRAEWKLNEELVRNEHRLTRERERDAKDDPLYELMEPVRKLYQKANRFDKQYMIYRILKCLT